MQRLQISDNKHGFVLEDGSPFFWLGDTAWVLFMVSEEDIEFYMADRASRGFNVIQCMVIRTIPPDKNELIPCHGGALPFSSLDPLEFNEDYFAHMDFIVDCALRHGLRMAMATMWGPDADGMFRDSERDNYAYARFLGERYKDRPNVIWIASGEYDKIMPDWKEMKQTIDDRQKRLLSRLGEGLRDASKGRSLITVHPNFTLLQIFTIRPGSILTCSRPMAIFRPTSRGSPRTTRERPQNPCSTASRDTSTARGRIKRARKHPGICATKAIGPCFPARPDLHMARTEFGNLRKIGVRRLNSKAARKCAICGG